MNTDALHRQLCRAFCDDITVREVDNGVVISARYSDEFGDPIECFVETSETGSWIISDDGQFVPDLIGKGLDITSKSRADFLARAMKISGAYYSPDEFTIRTEEFDSFPDPGKIIDFLTTLVRARDVSFWTKERIRSTFKEDAFNALHVRLSNFRLLRNASIPGIDSLREFPADIVVTRPDSGADHATAIFLVQEIAAMNEALILWQAATVIKHDVAVMALVEDAKRLNMNGQKVQRALNRIDSVAVWADDREASADKIAKNVVRQLATA
ncbi:DUF1828 domain-containing protein [Gluconacetobacter azotocaptans]|uniref:DUF1828 domain-containing protein n=1 Tax=Gluconacetobacter azotocaptans TaxID=142834 RepID=UPI00195CC915|nr:DUF1828 domain-containing protein [Gluconacetobacter azotocaptans]MBM9401568.1 DUF1828 domain-containing protein [Gluconacetobacter azotocaptans]